MFYGHWPASNKLFHVVQFMMHRSGLHPIQNANCLVNEVIKCCSQITNCLTHLYHGENCRLPLPFVCWLILLSKLLTTLTSFIYWPSVWLGRGMWEKDGVRKLSFAKLNTSIREIKNNKNTVAKLQGKVTCYVFEIIQVSTEKMGQGGDVKVLWVHTPPFVFWCTFKWTYDQPIGRFLLKTE